MGVLDVLVGDFEDLVELGQPAHRQVAVLKADPIARLPTHLHQPLGDRALPLPQTHDLEPGPLLAVLFGEVEQVVVDIGPRRQDEDEGRVGLGVGEGPGQVERRRFSELR